MAHLEKPFFIQHPDGRGYALEGDQAVDLYLDHYKGEGFRIPKVQPAYCEIPEALQRKATHKTKVTEQEWPKWFSDRVAKAKEADEEIPMYLEDEKAGEYDERVKAEAEAATELLEVPPIVPDNGDAPPENP